MKKMNALGLVALLAAGLCVPAMAANNGNMSMDQMGQDMMAMSDPQAGQKMLDKMKSNLQLNDQQTQQMKDMINQRQAAMQPLWKKMQSDLDSLNQKVQAKAPDSEIQPILDTLASDREALQSERTKWEDSSKKILTPTQQAKMVLEMHSKMANKMKNRHARNASGMYGNMNNTSGSAQSGDWNSNSQNSKQNK